MIGDKIKQSLQLFLQLHDLDDYCDLDSLMLSEHLVRWMEEYVRQQNVAKTWQLTLKGD